MWQRYRLSAGVAVVPPPIRGEPQLVQDSAMEALANSIGLRALGLCAAVVDVLDRGAMARSW